MDDTHGLTPIELADTFTVYEDESGELDSHWRYALLHSSLSGWLLHGKVILALAPAQENAKAQAKREETQRAALALKAALPGRGCRLTAAMADGLRALNRGVSEYRALLLR